MPSLFCWSEWTEDGFLFVLLAEKNKTPKYVLVSSNIPWLKLLFVRFAMKKTFDKTAFCERSILYQKEKYSFLFTVFTVKGKAKQMCWTVPKSKHTIFWESLNDVTTHCFLSTLWRPEVATGRSESRKLQKPVCCCKLMRKTRCQISFFAEDTWRHRRDVTYKVDARWNVSIVSHLSMK